MKKISSLVLGLVLVVAGAGFAAQGAYAQSNLPTGCSSTSGFSAITGAACNGATSYPSGCISASGFSNTTGQSCNGVAYAMNGYSVYPAGCINSSGYSTVNNIPCDGASGVGPNGQTYYVAGCTSLSGYSTSTGLACNSIITTSTVNVVTYLPGCVSMSGFSTLTGQSCVISSVNNNTGGGTVINPGLPVTGAGSDAPLSIALLVLSGALVAYGVTKLVRSNA